MRNKILLCQEGEFGGGLFLASSSLDKLLTCEPKFLKQMMDVKEVLNMETGGKRQTVKGKFDK